MTDAGVPSPPPPLYATADAACEMIPISPGINSIAAVAIADSAPPVPPCAHPEVAEIQGMPMHPSLPQLDILTGVLFRNPKLREAIVECWDPITKSALTKIPLLTTRAGPRDGAAWTLWLVEEYKGLIAYSAMYKANDLDWFHRRKDSLASSSSAHHSDGGIIGGMSPEILSTAAAANDSLRLLFVGALLPAGFPDTLVLPANPACASIGDAWKVFDGIGRPMVEVFMAMVDGYSVDGEGEEAMCLVRTVLRSGKDAEELGFVMFLRSCGMAMTLQVGQEVRAPLMKFVQEFGMENLHCLIDQFGWEPGMETLDCLIDLYEKCDKACAGVLGSEEG